MADKPFDRVVAYDLAVLKHEHLNRAYSQFDMTARELARVAAMKRSDNLSTSAYSTAPTGRQGFIGAGFMPTWVSGMNVRLLAGQGFQQDATTSTDINGIGGLDDLSTFKPLVLPANVDIAVPAADPTNPRIDLIEVRYNGRRADTESLVYLSDPTNGVLSSASYLMSYTYGLSAPDVGYVLDPASSTTAIGYKQGVAAGSPSAPSVSSGYIAVGYIAVGAGAVVLSDAYINDYRRVLGPRRVSVSLTKASGANGLISNVVIDAPPGVLARVVNNVTSGGARFNVLIMDWYSAFNGSQQALPVQVSAFPTAGLTLPYTTSQVTAYAYCNNRVFSGTDVTNLADAALTFPATLTRASTGIYRLYDLFVFHQRHAAGTIDHNIPTCRTTVTFDIPEV